MDPKAFAEHLKAKWSTREADERAKQLAEKEAGRALQLAIVERVIPCFETLREAGPDIFDFRAVIEPDQSEISWVEFQFERGEVFRLGRQGASFLVERREGPPPSGFVNVKPKTVIRRAEELTTVSIGALLEELFKLPPPLKLLLRTKTDLDGNPV
jgi:hypothetical protein